MINVDLIFRKLKEQGKTQKDLANAIGVSTGNVSDWKKGKAKPSAPVLPKIAVYLGITTAELLGESPTPHINRDAAELDGYLDISELPPEAREEMEQYQEFLKMKYGKK